MTNPTQAQSAKFHEIFGISLSKYWSPLLGFDVVGFDEQVVKSSIGESCAHRIRCNYGDSALNLVRELLGMAATAATTARVMDNESDAQFSREDSHV